MPPNRSYLGETRHNLTCIGYHKGPGYRYTLDVRCVCGVVKQISSTKFGKTKSCGACQPHPGFRHGRARDRLYLRFIAIKNRCNNPNSDVYRHYGGRGIRCHWQTFEEFLRDMGEPPNPQMTIERIDGDGDYCAENCVWADWFVQANHTRRNVRLEYQSENLTISQWARRVGSTPSKISHRLAAGWSIERALTEPSHPHERRSDEGRERKASGKNRGPP